MIALSRRGALAVFVGGLMTGNARPSLGEPRIGGEWREADRLRFYEMRRAVRAYQDMGDYRFAHAMLIRVQRHRAEPDARDTVIETLQRNIPRFREDLHRDGLREMERVLRVALVHLTPEDEE